MSGAIILIVVSAYDYVAGCVVAEEIRRRKVQTCVDASPGSPFAARLEHYGLKPAETDLPPTQPISPIIVPQTFASSPDLLSDLEAFHAWLLDGQCTAQSLRPAADQRRHLPTASALSSNEQAQARATSAEPSTFGILDRLSRVDLAEGI